MSKETGMPQPEPVVIDDDMLARVDRFAETRGATRNDTIKVLLAIGLAAVEEPADEPRTRNSRKIPQLYV